MRPCPARCRDLQLRRAAMHGHLAHHSRVVHQLTNQVDPSPWQQPLSGWSLPRGRWQAWHLWVGVPTPMTGSVDQAHQGGSMVVWDQVTHGDVLRAIREYDRLGPERFFSEHGFVRTTTYELVFDERRYPPKAILGTAYEFATGQRLGSGDFEGGKTGAVKVLGKLGFTIQAIRGAQ